MNLGTKALQVLRAVAPTLGTAIGGPFGALAGSLVSTAIGVATGDDSAAETALTAATPDQLLALKKAENDFKVQMRDLGVQEEQIAAADTANARQREVDLKDWVTPILAVLVTFGFFGILGWMLRYGVPKDNGDVLLVLLGSLGTAWTGIIGYYFGSSIGARKQSEALVSIAKAP